MSQEGPAMAARKPAARTRRGFGAIRALPSGRYQAHYLDPDKVKRSAPSTFDTRQDAEAWLTDRYREISAGSWEAPAPVVAPITLGEYAENWWTNRTLEPRTRVGYRDLLDRFILPRFRPDSVKDIDPAAVRTWYATLPANTPTQRAHTYSLFHSILEDAVYDGLLPVNPCHIRGAGSAKKVHKTRPATLAELEIIVGAMPTRYGVMTLLAAWCAFRFGELTELRRKDIDLDNEIIHIDRGVVRLRGELKDAVRLPGTFVIGTPKTESSVRGVDIPPHLIPALRDHLDTLPAGPDALLFPAAEGGGSMAPSTLYKVYYPAREKAGRPDLRFHDLRHTGAVLTASTGATLKELMERLGHSTPAAALRYQHAAAGRGKIIAAALSALVEKR